MFDFIFFYFDVYSELISLFLSDFDFAIRYF